MPTSRLALLYKRLLAWIARPGAQATTRPHRGSTAPESPPDFAEERTFSESDPAAQSPKGKGDEAPHWPTRTDSRPGRPV